MNALAAYLPPLLCLAAIGQALIAILNLYLVRLLHWEEPVARMPLLVREVFHVHAWFISITLTIFAVLTWRFAGDLSSLALGRWLAGGIALFWGLRAILQVTYYSSEHWRGHPGPTAVHITLLIVYGGFTLVYGMAAAGS